MKYKNILVFGGSGFLGLYLITELLKRNYKVYVADIKPPCCSVKKKITEYYKCNILNKEKVEEVINNQVFDVVYNLAGFASLDLAVKQPIETIQLNIIGNLNILETCRKKIIKRYIYASSAYAISNKGSFYGISKLTSEKIIEEYQERYGLDFTILRYGSVYADKKFGNNYLYSLIEEAIKTNKIIHSSDGEELREYIHAVDAAKLSVDILKNSQFINQHIILTGTEKIKRVELFKLINEIIGGKLTIVLKNEGYNQHHYKYSPYSFEPKKSLKLVANPHIDMGQGILECIKDIYEQNNYTSE